MESSKIKTLWALLSPPGDTLQETLDEIGMTQKELAYRMGITPKTVNEIVKGIHVLSVETALKLENVLGIPLSFWLNREKEYREELAKIEEEEKLAKEIEWLKCFPIKEMKQQKWLPDTKDKTELVKGLLQFFGIASPQQWKDIYINNKDQAVTIGFRVSLAHTNNAGPISVWLRKGQIETMKLNIKAYDKTKFKQILQDIKLLAYHQPKDFAAQLKEICSEAGVVIIYTPKLPKATISGAARWIYDKPVIQLTDRYKSNDHFWFTFFHEAGHIILHGKKDVFLEDIEGGQVDKIKEEEADDFANKNLFGRQFVKEVSSFFEFDDKLIMELSKKYSIHPASIVGYLQHNKIIGFNKFNKYKVKINLFE